MIEVRRRRLTAEETERLTLAAQAGNGEAEEAEFDWVGVGFGGVLGLLLARGGAPWFVALPAGALAWRMAVVARRRRREAAALFGDASAAVYRQDLQGGEVEIMEVEASAVVARSDRSDEPPAFVFDVGDGELLAICDPALAQAVGQGSFPNDRFELVLGPKSGAVLDLRCTGRPLTPVRTLEFDLYGSPQVFEGVLAEITDDDSIR